MSADLSPGMAVCSGRDVGIFVRVDGDVATWRTADGSMSINVRWLSVLSPAEIYRHRKRLRRACTRAGLPGLRVRARSVTDG